MITLLAIDNSNEKGIPIEVKINSSISDLKKEIAKRMNIPMKMALDFNGIFLHDESETLRDFDIEDGDYIFVCTEYEKVSPWIENINFVTNINAVKRRRKNVENIYFYHIKGSIEGTVWGDHIYTDDSNIAKAAVLEGKCNIGQNKLIGIKIIEGKTSYSSCNRNGASSSSRGAWPASYIFL